MFEKRFNLKRRTSTLLAASVACANIAAGVGPAWALPGTTNMSLAPTASATGTSVAYGSSFEDAIDGNRNGDYAAGSIYHSEDIDPGRFPLFYEVDLGVNAYIERVQLIQRTDVYAGVYGNFRLTVFEDDGAGNPGAVAFTSDYLTDHFQGATWATTDPGGSAAGGAFGRHVRFERLDDNYWILFSEFEVIGRTTPLAFTEANNIAAGKPVTTSSPPGFDAFLTSGNDNDVNGDFGVPGYRPVYHSTDQGVGEYWQVDLGAPTPLNFLELFVRSGQTTTTEFKVSVLDASQAEVGAFTIAVNPVQSADPGFDYTIDAPGLTGQFIRVETTQDEFLAFSELRAWASTAIQGDYNNDGKVDAADYVVWRKTIGTQPAYDLWRANFGEGAGSGGASELDLTSVPEPASWIIVLVIACALNFHDRCTRKSSV